MALGTVGNLNDGDPIDNLFQSLAGRQFVKGNTELGPCTITANSKAVFIRVESFDGTGDYIYSIHVKADGRVGHFEYVWVDEETWQLCTVNVENLQEAMPVLNTIVTTFNEENPTGEPAQASPDFERFRTQIGEIILPRSSQM